MAIDKSSNVHIGENPFAIDVALFNHQPYFSLLTVESNFKIEDFQNGVGTAERVTIAFDPGTSLVTHSLMPYSGPNDLLVLAPGNSSKNYVDFSSGSFQHTCDWYGKTFQISAPDRQHYQEIQAVLLLIKIVDRGSIHLNISVVFISSSLKKDI